MAKELVRYPWSRMTRPPRALWFIKRGPRPEHHRAPFHPAVICTRRYTAKWEAGWTGDRAWIWWHEGKEPYTGWLLERWQGLDIDYGGLVKCCKLPDGTQVGFFHRHRALGYDRPGEKGATHLGYSEELQEPWSLLPGAVWWSDDPIPAWLVEAGVVLAEDDFTQQVIKEDAGDFVLPEKQRDKLWEKRNG
jgi:hypothetical protein